MKNLLKGLWTLLSYKSNSTQDGKNFCRKNAQETQKKENFFVLFVPFCG